MAVQPYMEWIPIKENNGKPPKISRLVPEMVISAGEVSIDVITDLMIEIIVEVVISTL